ncbi:MAG: hypothetical protein KGL39_50665 [Patescibacteria group bacterium]|nr:hypothetical protein [Patescibacteria group bacterium]
MTRAIETRRHETGDTTVTAIKTGWVACDYTDGDRLDLAAHGDIRATEQEARVDQLARNLEGVRYIAADGYLYVEPPTALAAEHDGGAGVIDVDGVSCRSNET